jgi:hypothetical protein
VYVDKEDRTYTKEINYVIETIHVFVDCLSMWPTLLIAITRNIAELERMRKLLITKRERFRFKLESVSSILFYPEQRNFQ